MPISHLTRFFAERSCGPRVRLGRKALHTVFATATLAALFKLCLAAQPGFSIAWTDARLSVRADAAPLAAILGEVARQTGAVIVSLDRVEGTYSGEIVERPLVEVLRTLLADRDHLIAGRADARRGAEVRVWLYARGGAADMPARAPADNTVAESPPDADQVVEDPGRGDADEPATPDEADLQRLEGAGFFDAANASLLADTAHSPQAAVRAKALRVLTARDPSMAVDVLADAMGDASPVVNSAAAEMLDTVDGPDVQERLGTLLQHADPVVRYGALELLRRRTTDPRLLPYLQQALRDENEAVRLTAAALVRELATRAQKGGRQ